MKKRTIAALLREAYLEGFNASGEGWNGEYPFRDRDNPPELDERWAIRRHENLKALQKEAKKLLKELSQ